MMGRVGEKWETKGCGKITIVAYTNAHNCDVKFEDGTIVKDVSYGNIKKGAVSNPNTPTAYGVGFIGQGKYSSKINGKITKVYDTWIGMFRRCYSKDFHIKYTTYKECVVDEYWHNFQIFAQWYEENYINDYQIDKDILVKGNKVYSPETCCFVPHEINSLFLTCKSKRGVYPVGVSKKGSMFRATLTTQGKQKYIGIFTTPEEAFKAYKEVKEHQIKKTAIDYYSRGKIPLKVYNAMYNYKIEITD